MNIVRSAAFTADRAWGALDIANLGASRFACTGPTSRIDGT